MQRMVPLLFLSAVLLAQAQRQAWPECLSDADKLVYKTIRKVKLYLHGFNHNRDGNQMFIATMRRVDEFFASIGWLKGHRLSTPSR